MEWNAEMYKFDLMKVVEKKYRASGAQGLSREVNLIKKIWNYFFLFGFVSEIRRMAMIIPIFEILLFKILIRNPNRFRDRDFF